MSTNKPSRLSWATIKNHPTTLFWLLNLKTAIDFYGVLMRHWYVWIVPLAIVSFIAGTGRIILVTEHSDQEANGLSLSKEVTAYPIWVSVIVLIIFAATTAAAYLMVRPSVERKDWHYVDLYKVLYLKATLMILVIKSALAILAMLTIVAVSYSAIAVFGRTDALFEALLMIFPALFEFWGGSLFYLCGSPFIAFTILFIYEKCSPHRAIARSFALVWRNPLTIFGIYTCWFFSIALIQDLFARFNILFIAGFDITIIVLFFALFIPCIVWTNLWVKKVYARVSDYVC